MAIDQKKIQSHVANDEVLEGEALAEADYNQDGKVNIKDATAYQKQQTNSPIYETAAQKVDNDAIKTESSTVPSNTPGASTTSTVPPLVESAMQKLNSDMAPYASKYQGDIEATLSAIENKKPFSYDLNGDIIYHQYADIYGRNAEKAMKNTVGQVSSLSGGYGNSYAQTAGQQAYADTMSGLNDIIPELYNLAYNKYNQEQQDMKDMLSIYQSMDNADYGRYIDDRNYNYQLGRDAVNDAWRQTEHDRAVFESDRAFNETVREFNEQMDFKMMTHEESVREFNATFSLDEKQYLYNSGWAKIQIDKQPSNAECIAMGITPEGAREMREKYKTAVAASVSKGGGSGYSGGSFRSSSGVYTKTEIKNLYNSGNKQDAINAIVSQEGANAYTYAAANLGLNKDEVDYIYTGGQITSKEQLVYLLNKYGTSNAPSAENIQSYGEWTAKSHMSDYPSYSSFLTNVYGKYIDWSI